MRAIDLFHSSPSGLSQTDHSPGSAPLQNLTPLYRIRHTQIVASPLQPAAFPQPALSLIIIIFLSKRKYFIRERKESGNKSIEGMQSAEFAEAKQSAEVAEAKQSAEVADAKQSAEFAKARQSAEVAEARQTRAVGNRSRTMECLT